MKIKRLYIKEYRQFKDVEFHFHEHKNCIIGQSGTGKTTLLNLIYSFLNLISGKEDTNFNFKDDQFEIDFKIGGELFKYKDNKIKYKDLPFDCYNFLKNKIAINHVVAINNPTYTIYLTNDLSHQEGYLHQKINEDKPIIHVVSEPEVKFFTSKKTDKIIDIHTTIILDQNTKDEFYQELLNEIISFDRELLNKFSSSGLNDLNALIDFRDKNSPRKKIADECLNNVLKEFHLVMDPGVTDSYITIKHSSGDRIAPAQLSTGTKQVILSSLPIYLLRDQLSVVLFDEPERSLFPDIQKLLPDHYTSLAPDAQFFFVTHSPFFAAGFNEDERINLYFNDAGYVTQETVSKGRSPKGDDANDMLYNDFKVSSMNDYGLEMHQKYLALNDQADQQSAQGQPVDKALLKEIRELGDKYNF